MEIMPRAHGRVRISIIGKDETDLISLFPRDD